LRALRLLATCALTAALVIGTAAAQTATPSADNPKPAANAWMLTPSSYLERSWDIPESLRRERDQFWDNASMSRVPLTAAGHGSVSSGEDYDVMVDPGDIRRAPSRAIVTATFKAHRSILSSSEFSLYTEITLLVDKVFEDQTASGSLSANRDITVPVYGGTVLLATGKPLSINTRPRELFLQPGHKYLLVLSYHPKGDFYEYLDSWDISKGTVQPNNSRTQYVARSGKSELSGVPADQIGPVLDKELRSDR
jgi:hypothetical protein